MKQYIDLTTFLNSGGTLDTFPLNSARILYNDDGKYKVIDRIESSDAYFRVFFTDGTSNVYGGIWIESVVDY